MKKEETRVSGRKTESERKALEMGGVWFPNATVRASFWAVASRLHICCPAICCQTCHMLLKTRDYLEAEQRLVLS